jgi:hypothetical protein
MGVDWKVAQINALRHNNSIGEEAKNIFSDFSTDLLTIRSIKFQCSFFFSSEELIKNFSLQGTLSKDQ